MNTLLVSIVSHGQGALVKDLLEDLSSLNMSIFSSTKVVVTLNIPEDEDFLSAYSGDISVLRNPRKLGYGSNHNQAFAVGKSDYFLVLNPDIRINNLDFRSLLNVLNSRQGVVAPAVYSPQGDLEDSFRAYPSILRIFKRVVLNNRKPEYDFGIPGRPDASVAHPVDWVAGMFMLFNSGTYREVAGFDPSYFMYLEDADICKRLNQSGRAVFYLPSEKVVHAARRQSRKNNQHKKWHVRSMLRFLFGL